jgi:hypothetical protein
LLLERLGEEVILRKLFVLPFIIAGAISFASGQDRQHATISGFVYDAANGEALIGANVYLDKTRIGASTNNSGYYVIPRIPAGAYTLIVQHIGYRTYQQHISLPEE